MLVSLPPRQIVDAYLALAAKHNDPATPEHERHIAYWESRGVMMAVEAMGWWVGSIITEADMALPGDDRPACAGFYLDVERAA